MIRIIIADDDPVIVQGLSMIIGSKDGFDVVGSAEDGREAIRLARETRPDVAVLDIRMPFMNGIEAASVMLKEELCSPLLLTTFDEPDLIADALLAGARGYILKKQPCGANTVCYHGRCRRRHCLRAGCDRLYKKHDKNSAKKRQP